MSKTTNATLQVIYTKFHFAIILIALSIFVSSCNLFDKEIKQDKHIAEFRHKMNRIVDSLDNQKERITALTSILEQIHADEDLITPRKKNILLIEANTIICNEYLNIENYKKAIDHTNTIIAIDSTSPKGFYSRGCIYQMLDEDSLAILDYTKAVSLNSDYSDAYYNRGIIYEGLGNYDKALNDYSKAIKLNPSYVIDIYNNRGNTYLAKDAYDKAISDYNKVIAIDTTNVKAYSNRAGAYMMQKDFDKALADCNKAIALDSTNVNAYRKRAAIYEEEKKYNEALSDYERILDLDPKNKLDTHEAINKAIKRLKPLARKR
ncbi:tetratricopeptide repeat protein [Prevotella sp. 10(H)]|uniref:tetratricopeptide repeat protein n=1 Tax=Prevotella sp. 10(H) TaxID=1158294 RepID=UPI0004A70DD7|nr:tetratricopeptide repeat protein [Prevotella sp. 10(H)]